MSEYAVIDGDGAVARSGVCPASMIAIQAHHEGERVVELREGAQVQVAAKADCSYDDLLEQGWMES